CSSRIDCCNCGVSVRCWLSLSWRVCFMRYVTVVCSEPEMLAEIDLSNGLIINNLARSARSEHPALVDDVGPVANAERLPYVMVGDQYSYRPFFQKTDDFLYIEHRNRVDPGERLVQQDEPR